MKTLSQKKAIQGFMERYEIRNVFSPPPEVEKPTYEVVGDVERYDQRDHPTARAYLVPGSNEYDDYYSRHPELKEWDDENRKRRAKQDEKWREADPIGSQFGPSVFYSRRVLGLPDIVEGKVAARHKKDVDKVNADPKAVGDIIKSYAQYLGAARVRIARLNHDWVYTNYAAPYTLEPYGKPVDLNYKYIICMAIPQNRMMMASGDGIPQYLEVGWIYTYASLMSVIIAHFVRSLGWSAKALSSENSPYLVVPAFVDAGIGEQGRCSYVVTKEFGNNFRPGAVVTDMPLEIDKPVDFGLQDFCKKCKICADHCPSGAIPKGDREVVRGVRIWKFDGDKCRRYWDSIGHPCGICQHVCPWNFPNTLFHNSIRELAQRFTSLRSPAIWGHKTFYGFKRGPEPEWIKHSSEAIHQNTD